MIAYKLVRKLKDGSISPLFINKMLRIPINVWLKAEPHLTKGFKFRPGWHCTLQPTAHHLSKIGRVWYKVDIENFKLYNRPANQGGVWALADKIRFIEEVNGK